MLYQLYCSGEFENVQRVKLSENDSPHYEIEVRLSVRQIKPSGCMSSMS